MSESHRDPTSEATSLHSIAIWFAAGAVVTAAFSASLARLAPHANFAEVLIAGMVIPSFTWVVQLTASGFLLDSAACRDYWTALSRTCMWGSAALLPAAIFDIALRQPPLWIPVVNVVASVLLMAGYLFLATTRTTITRSWPISWCITIATNMAIFTWWSWNWW